MNTMYKFFYPSYYASLDIADYIVYNSLEWYLSKIQPNINNNNYWLPTCNSPNDTKLKHEILDLLIIKLMEACKKNNIKLYLKEHEWRSSLILQISIHIFDQLIHYYDRCYPNNFKFYEDKRYKINYYIPIYFMASNPFTNPETGSTFDYPAFDKIMFHFRDHFLVMHNDIEPTNSIISLKTLNVDEQYILQEKLIFLIIKIINRTDFEHIVKVIDEQQIKERKIQIKPNAYSCKIIPING